MKGGSLLGEVSLLNVDTMTYSVTTPSSARHSANLTPSEDGTRLWVFGGADTDSSLDDLHCFDTTIGTWVTMRHAPPFEDSSLRAQGLKCTAERTLTKMLHLYMIEAQRNSLETFLFASLRETEMVSSEH